MAPRQHPVTSHRRSLRLCQEASLDRPRAVFSLPEAIVTRHHPQRHRAPDLGHVPAVGRNRVATTAPSPASSSARTPGWGTRIDHYQVVETDRCVGRIETQDGEIEAGKAAGDAGGPNPLAVADYVDGAPVDELVRRKGEIPPVTVFRQRHGARQIVAKQQIETAATAGATSVVADRQRDKDDRPLELHHEIGLRCARNGIRGQEVVVEWSAIKLRGPPATPATLP